MKLTQALVRIAWAAIVFAPLNLSAQEVKIQARDVPAAVTAAFKAAYPTATIRGYAREKENGKTFYEIESKDGSIGRDVLYNPDGSVAEIEESLAPGDLPAGTQDTILKKYRGAVAVKAEKTTERTAQGEKAGYEVIVRQGKKHFTLLFDGAGNLKGK